MSSIRTTINVTTRKALMAKFINEAYDLLEEMVSNNYQWPFERVMPRRVAGVHELHVINALIA